MLKRLVRKTFMNKKMLFFGAVVKLRQNFASFTRICSSSGSAPEKATASAYDDFDKLTLVQSHDRLQKFYPHTSLSFH